MLRIGLAALGIALIAGGAGWWVGQSWFGTGQLSGAPAGEAKTLIDIELADLTGRPRRFSEWAGRPVVLNFWATWCPPCREEIPLFVELQKRHGDAVQFIGVALDDPQAVARFSQEHGINYPILPAGAEGFALMDRYGNARSVLPFTVIADAGGRIVERRVGAYRREQLERSISPLLQNPAKSR